MSWGSDLLVDARISRRMAWITRFTLARSDALVGDCQVVRHAAEGFGLPAGRCVLFPWGVDLARFSPPEPAGEGALADAALLRKRLGWQDAFVILSLRSWEPVYGVDVVVKGFARAVEQEPRLRLFLLGNGSLAGQVQALIEQHGLREMVSLVGQVSQAALPGFYRAADLYVSASHSDGSSVSLMEALASGLPALVSDIPGNREWIEPGEAGWLFSDGDAEALSAGMLRAAQEPDTLAPMRAAARALAERRANWAENSKQLFKAYRLAIGLRERRQAA
jgi:glycosyltransferase involved in cell wall biosynthesis